MLHAPIHSRRWVLLSGILLLAAGILLQALALRRDLSRAERLDEDPVVELRRALRGAPPAAGWAPLLDALEGPSSAAAVPLLRDLSRRDGGPDVLRDTLRALERIGGDDAARLLSEVGSARPELISEAALRLSRIDGRNASGALMEILELESGPVPIREAAARALGRARLRAALEPLRRIAGAADAELKQAGIEALGLIGDPEGAQAVAPALDDPDPKVRRAAIRALGNLRCDTSLRALEGFLSDAGRPEAESALARRALAVLRGEEPSKSL